MHLQSSHFQPVGPICIQTTDLSIIHVTAPRPSCRTGAAISLHNLFTYKLQVKTSSEFLDDGGAWLLDFEPPRVIYLANQHEHNIISANQSGLEFETERSDIFSPNDLIISSMSIVYSSH
jgi:hypothetical protein